MQVFIVVVVLKEAPGFGPFSKRYEMLSAMANGNLWSAAKVIGAHFNRLDAETQAKSLGFRIEDMTNKNVCPTDEYAYIVEQTAKE